MPRAFKKKIAKNRSTATTDWLKEMREREYEELTTGKKNEQESRQAERDKS